ncbi:CMGC/DYRK/DYRK2 protein kinase [Lentinula aff. detonsa]|nr:CMGC/DYRK/DYRK2 protein kinase [Lentinula aff. detonsa]
MSAPPSPRSHNHALQRKRDRPPALDIQQNKASSDTDVFIQPHLQQPSVHVELAPPEEERPSDLDYPQSRAGSATSSLDPYYFGIRSPSDSPVPPLPTSGAFTSRTPDRSPLQEPYTPAKDPSSIDRRGLVGVGELTTPRWTRTEQAAEWRPASIVAPENEVDEQDMPDSPWTIEAVDGETSEREDVRFFYFKLALIFKLKRPLRERPSMTEESGGEEILYPRKSSTAAPRLPDLPSADAFSSTFSISSAPVDAVAATSLPPSAFSPPQRKARKRSSDEFEMDQTGLLVIKRVGPTDRSKDEKPITRKHRSVTATVSPSSPRDSRGKERRRESSGLTTMNSGMKLKPHSRHASLSSSSSNIGENKRATTGADYSHLPPSPSSSSIQHFLRGASAAPNTPPSSASKELPHPSPSVAHSLLRGTQEGWSGMGDEATAEALRKLDGLSGKSARARASIGSFGRPHSQSRPGTPASRTGTGTQWEGVASSSDGGVKRRGSSRRESANSVKEKEPRPVIGLGLGLMSPNLDLESIGSALTSSDDQPVTYTSVAVEKTPKKSGTTSTRSSFTPKRGSTSSATNTSTPTTSSRDSVNMSAATSMTSMSSTRHSVSKTRRNSAGSDVSSIHSSDAHSLKDRVASIASNGDGNEEGIVPPVPPLPKDLSTYRTPPATAVGLSFPHVQEDKPRSSHDSDRSTTLKVPPSSSNKQSSTRRQSQHYGASESNGSSQLAPAVPKTPSKKWSFSNALNLKLPGSPSTKSSGFPVSPRAVTFNGQHSQSQSPQLRKSVSKEQTLSPSAVPAKSPWSPRHPDAMGSAASLASLSSVGSVRTPAVASTTNTPSVSKTPDRSAVSSRAGTDSSASTNHTYAGLSAPQTYAGPLSPSSSVRRNQSKRLTPSSIPFFRRSSSQSMQVPSNSVSASSPTLSTDSATSPIPDYATQSTKSSVLSLGSLLKSSSRKSLHELQKVRDAVKDSDKEASHKEGRISVLMGRKRGKTLSAADPKKPRSPPALPPMQISALEPATAQRVARLKAPGTTVTAPTASSISRVASTSSRHSDTSLRTRNQLPTIAGSPSENKEPPPSTLMNSTPTKIPRISSRTSAVSSPPLKSGNTTRPNPSPTTSQSTNEFGVIENGDGPTPKMTSRTASARNSPSTAANTSTSRVPRQISISASTSTSSNSISFGLRKASTGSVASMSTAANANVTVTNETSTSHHRFSALSPSKGLKLLSPKISLSSARSSHTGSLQSIASSATPTSSRHSLATPSPAPSSVDEEEQAGDEEMLQYIRRQQSHKLQAGATQEELDKLLDFPEPIKPTSPMTPAAILKSNQSEYLCDFERTEIQDYPNAYYIGARSKKHYASPDHTTNNYGYDDDRGDYQVVNHDHLAYRYEIIDTLGKGSFGQVLHCRDHCTGESVAIKIIRNKKRFHHQALVEIKILDNLRKWDAEEKHHVIKMTEHFYFRNHLCIAMELLSINLYELIKANGFVGFTTALIRRFTSQMLMSLTLMRHHRIVHCDLKPENVLLRHPAKSALKVIDFGSSCLEHEKKLYTGYPIFPGENEQEQLSCIMEVLGVPDKEFVNRSSRKKLFFEPNGAPRAVINSKGRRRRPGTKTLAQALRCNDEDFIDFIAKCLVWDPERRIRPQAALRHPFITASRKPKPPPSSGKSTLSSSTLSGRKKDVMETPKKSLISAPTPLTARSSRITGGVPTTPSTSTHSSTLTSSSRSYRTSQAHSLSSHHSSRTLNGYVAAGK